MLILLLHFIQHSEAVFLQQEHKHCECGCQDKVIFALQHIKSNVMENVNHCVALHSALCGSILASIALTFCITDLIMNSFFDCCFLLAMLCKMFTLLLHCNQHSVAVFVQ